MKQALQLDSPPSCREGPYFEALRCVNLLLQQQIALSSGHRQPALDLCKLCFPRRRLIPQRTELDPVPLNFTLNTLLQLGQNLQHSRDLATARSLHTLLSRCSRVT